MQTEVGAWDAAAGQLTDTLGTFVGIHCMNENR